MYLRYSKQRTLILKIVRSTHSHPTAYWVYNKAKKIMPKISKGTIYRNLNQWDLPLLNLPYFCRPLYLPDVSQLP